MIISLKKTLQLVLLLTAFSSFAQLPDFTLTVTPTAQTCPGNGSLAFSVSGVNQAATLSYAVYLLPNTTTPITIVNSGPVINLAAGSYQVVATQSLGAQSNTSTATVAIANDVQALTYTLTPTNVRCGNDGKITVNAVTGTPVSYQITAGPVTTPVQTSNVFNNLPAGQYQVRVFDSCGEAVVTTFQLITATPLVVIDGATILPGILPTCNTVSVSNFFGTLTGNEIFYPLTIEFSVFPPGGGPATVLTQTVATGTNSGAIVNANIPFYNAQNYTYNIKVTDACGNVFVRNNNLVNKKFDVGLSDAVNNCTEQSFTINPAFYRPPYTINFLSAPSTFVPSAYNASHPNFTAAAVYAMPNGTVPEGAYSVLITDACGRTVTKNFTIELPDVNPAVSGMAEGCTGFGNISINIPNRQIQSVVIEIAPPAYGPFPYDVSGNITLQGFSIDNVPLGSYTFTITDTCGDTYSETYLLEPEGANPETIVLQRPGCSPGMGSVRLGIDEGAITTATITSGPPGFATPFDATSLINGGSVYLNSLPAGMYTVVTVDNCGITRTKDFVLDGYTITNNQIDVVPLCNSFNLQLAHTSNGNYVASYWLQKYDPLTNTWGYLGNGGVYTEGALPSPANSRQLNNNALNINISALGQFRVLKAFYTFSNGSPANFRCVQEIHNFEYDGNPVIQNAYSFPCANNLTEVAIEAIGVAPLIYSITTKDGEPFVINNGTSSVFTGLEPATYNFRVTDNCGNIRNRPFTINELDPITVTATQFCENQANTLSVQQFSFLSYEWWKEGEPGTILSTTSVLDFPSFNSVTQAGTYYVQITSGVANSCMNQLLEYTIQPNAIPAAGNDVTTALCNSADTVNLESYLTSPHDAGGTWADTSATGQLNGSQLTVTGLTGGTYNFTYTVSGGCGLTDEAIITIILNESPAPPVVAPVGSVCQGSDVQLTASAVPGAVYQWSGPNGFQSNEQNPVVTAAGVEAAGNYSVTVTLNGCASVPATVAVSINAFPQFTITGNTLLCSGQSTILTIVPSSLNQTGIIEGWYHDGELIPGVLSASIEVFETGVYKAVMSNTGCTSEQSVTVTPNTIAEVIVLEEGCNNNDEYTIMVANPDDFPGAVYVWSGPDGFTGSGEEVVITALPPGEYFVTVTNPAGCTTGTSTNVLNTHCKIPKGISVNGDGSNDAFDLSNFDVRNIKIFNRYGMAVYEKDNYKNEWKGQSYLGELPTGTYYYVLSLGTGKRLTGWVYLQKEI